MLFAACAFPVHVWAIVNVLRELPAWLLRLSLWELIGVISYTLVFTLVESLLFLLTLVLPATILPARLYRDRLVATGTMIVALTSLWAVAAHYNSEAIRAWGLREFALWGGLYLVSIVAGWLSVYLAKRLQRVLVAVADRLVVLTTVYLAVDIVALLIILVRNISGALA